jgi:hypothetical protein
MPSVFADDYHEQVMRSNPNELNYRDRAYYDDMKEMERDQEQRDYIKRLEKELKSLKKEK